MLKMGKVSLAIVLGLMISLTMFTSGAFADSVNSSNTSAITQVAVATNSVQGVSKILTTSATQQVQGGWSSGIDRWPGGWRGGGWRGGGWRGGGWRGGGWRGGGWRGGGWRGGG